MVLRRGRVYGDYRKDEISVSELVQMMAGGEDLEQLVHEIERISGDGDQSEKVAQDMAEVTGALSDDTRPGGDGGQAGRG